MLWLYRGRLKEEGTYKDNVASDDGGKKKQGRMELLIHSAPRGFRPQHVRGKLPCLMCLLARREFKEGMVGSMTTLRLKPYILCLRKFLLPPYTILIIKIPLGLSYIQPSFLNEKKSSFFVLKRPLDNALCFSTTTKIYRDSKRHEKTWMVLKYRSMYSD